MGIPTHFRTLKKDFTYIIYIFLSLASFGVYVFDLSTDIVNAFHYRARESDPNHEVYFAVSLGFVIGPALIIQISSAVFIISDLKKENKTKPKTWYITILILHILPLAPLYWYVKTIYFCYCAHRLSKLKKKAKIPKERDREDRKERVYASKSKYGFEDTGLLRVFESFLEAAPQLVLQSYIMLTTGVTPPITVASCVIGLFGTTTSMVTYQRALRASNPDSVNPLPIFWSGLVMGLWRLCTILARILCLSLLASTNLLWFGLLIAIHGFICLVLINIKGMDTELCPTAILRQLFNVISSLIYTFCYFNIHNDNENENSPSNNHDNKKSEFKIRYRMSIYYSVMIFENIGCTILWYYFRSGGLIEQWVTSDKNDTAITSSLAPVEKRFLMKIPASLCIAITVNLTYGLGLVFMVIYYLYFHPKKVAARNNNVKTSVAESSHTLLINATDDNEFIENEKVELHSTSELDPRKEIPNNGHSENVCLARSSCTCLGNIVDDNNCNENIFEKLSVSGYNLWKETTL